MPRMTQRRNANVASPDSDITSSLNKSNSRQSSKPSKDEKISKPFTKCPYCGSKLC